MERIALIVILLVFANGFLFSLWAVMDLSSRLSRIEEQRDRDMGLDEE